MAHTVIRPKGTEEGCREWMETTAELAKSWAKRAEGNVKELVKYLRDLRSHDWTQLTGGVKDWDKLCRDVLGYEPAFLQEMEAGVEVRWQLFCKKGNWYGMGRMA